jgi:hypothetical protein
VSPHPAHNGIKRHHLALHATANKQKWVAKTDGQRSRIPDKTGSSGTEVQTIPGRATFFFLGCFGGVAPSDAGRFLVRGGRPRPGLPWPPYRGGPLTEPPPPPPPRSG